MEDSQTTQPGHSIGFIVAVAVIAGFGAYLFAGEGKAPTCQSAISAPIGISSDTKLHVPNCQRNGLDGCVGEGAL